MRITWTRETDGEWEEYDTFSLVAINNEGEVQRFSIGNGEPEDMSLTRDLRDALKVPDLLRFAYDAGKRGEELTIEEGEK